MVSCILTLFAWNIYILMFVVYEKRNCMFYQKIILYINKTGLSKQYQ